MYIDGMLSDLVQAVKAMVSTAMVAAGRDKNGVHFRARSGSVLH